MTKFINPGDVLAIRNDVLRDGKLTLDECRFPTDTVEGAFHLGYYADGELATVASFFPKNYGDLCRFGLPVARYGNNGTISRAGAWAHGWLILR